MPGTIMNVPRLRDQWDQTGGGHRSEAVHRRPRPTVPAAVPASVSAAAGAAAAVTIVTVAVAAPAVPWQRRHCASAGARRRVAAAHLPLRY